MAKGKHTPEEDKQISGRPRKYATAAALKKKVDAYFRSVTPTKKEPLKPPPTLSGLSVYLDFADYSTFNDYENNPDFSHIIKKAKLRIAAAHEAQLFTTGCTGSIFWLKCNGGDMFKEQPQEHVVTGPLGIELEFVRPDETHTDT